MYNYREARQCARLSAQNERTHRAYIYIKIGVFNLKKNFKYYYFIEKWFFGILQHNNHFI